MFVCFANEEKSEYPKSKLISIVKVLVWGPPVSLTKVLESVMLLYRTRGLRKYF